MEGKETRSAGGNDGVSSSAPRLSRHSHSYLQKKLQKAAKKDVNGGMNGAKVSFKPQQRALQCLTTFDCPVCRLKDRVRVDLNAKEQQAVVRCTYCVSLRPRPSDLPYPFCTSFVPKLENRADVFFKFSELYRGLEKDALINGTLDDTKGVDEKDIPGDYSGDGVLAISSGLLASAAAEAQMVPNAVNGEDVMMDETDFADNESDGVADVHAFFGDSEGD